MAELKRWSVTYTKHMKQKRKVYQDGFLELNTSINKVLLYDDCDKLLECRLLKKDEEVSSGETLTFNAFLVDVNEADSAEGDRKPVPGFNSQAKDTKFNEKRAKPFVNTRNKPQPNLSPSQKIIREFKNRELHKYGAAQSSPETMKTSKTEWQVLYTTQLTQRAKKFHDGFLQLAVSGSYGKQVDLSYYPSVLICNLKFSYKSIILLDESRNLLDSRFLKKDEVLASGESIGFSAHLVEIGECEGDNKPRKNLHFKENKRNVVREAGVKHEQSNGVITDKAAEKEWKVLYTTQLTQKAKKYHDGFLKLAMCGSQRRQALLFDATEKLIDSKFLKKDEDIRSGESFTFDAHLVDIGEPEENHEALADLKFRGKDDCYVQETRKLGGGDDCGIVNNFEVKEWHALYTTQITQKAKKYHGGILRLDFSGSYRKKVSLLSEDKTMLSSKYISLSEDIRTGCMFELPKYLVEVGRLYTSSGGEGKPHNKDYLRKASESNLSISSVEETRSSRAVHTNKPLRDANQILSILQRPMAQERIVSGHADNSTARPIASTKESQVSDAIIVNFSEDARPSQPHRSVESIEQSENMDTGNPPAPMSFKAISSGSGSRVADGINMRNSDQFCPGHVKADTRQHDTAYTSDKSSLSSCVSHDAADEKSSSEEPTCEQIKECPSFDLGF
ncbi:uncharacterized protein LOC117626895 isoform X2 [Prunus dulcis]|uniref:uncharacterized protein LOC117626895 isoform X2 n=1 Tax=Prunus dulcis TaxID=3755 RepID=UPI001483978C|nr:uncharacterized protein LOC117626895 isoform X2 [Prunus dulcis]